MDDRYFAILPAVVIAFVLVFGICLLFGKASRFIPGYNARATDPNARSFEKIYCRYIGIFVLPFAPFVAGVFFGLMFHITWLAVVSAAVAITYALAGFIYLANNTKAKRALYLAKELEKNPKGLSVEEIERWKNELGTFGRTEK